MPIQRDPELEARVIELRAQGMTYRQIAEAAGCGIKRVRKILTIIAPGFAEPETKPTPKPSRTMPTQQPSTITIQLTRSAYDRLSWIADSAYMSPDAFAAALVASYISATPAAIAIQPADPDGDDDVEPDEDEPVEEEFDEDEEVDQEDQDQEAEEDEPPAEPDEPAEDPPAEEPATGEPASEGYAPLEALRRLKPGDKVVLHDDEGKSELCEIVTIFSGTLASYGDECRLRRKTGVLVNVYADEIEPAKGAKA